MKTIEEFVNERMDFCLNAITYPAKSSDFKVSFAGIPTNVSDILARQVKEISGTALSFDTLYHANRKTNYPDSGKISKSTIQATFALDCSGITKMILLSMIVNQKNGYSPRFDMFHYEMSPAPMGARSVTRYSKCIISSYTESDSITNADQNKTITVEFEFDSRDLYFVLDDDERVEVSMSP